MARQPKLTLAFLDHAPGSAAQVLEQLDPSEAAAFIERVPARIASAVIGRMSSWSGGRCLGLVEDASAAAILQQLAFRDGIGLLRLMAAGKRDELLDALPARRSRRFRNALRYPAGSVGAWTEPDVPAFSADATVGEAIRYLRHSEGISHVFLQSQRDGRFIGALPIAALLRSEASIQLGGLPSIRVAPISSRTSLADATRHDGWLDFLTLPVVGRSEAVVGGLSRAGLAKGLQEIRRPERAAPVSISGQLLLALGLSCVSLLRLLSSSMFAPTQRRRQENGHG